MAGVDHCRKAHLSSLTRGRRHSLPSIWTCSTLGWKSASSDTVEPAGRHSVVAFKTRRRRLGECTASSWSSSIAGHSIESLCFDQRSASATLATCSSSRMPASGPSPPIATLTRRRKGKNHFADGAALPDCLAWVAVSSSASAVVAFVSLFFSSFCSSSVARTG